MKRTVLSMITLVVLLVILTGGCASVGSNESDDGVYDYKRMPGHIPGVVESQEPVNQTGDVPKFGTYVNVVYTHGYETKGPYRTTVAWKYVGKEKVTSFAFDGESSLVGLSKEFDHTTAFIVAEGRRSGLPILYRYSEQ
ncbi:MAG: hypothetical protein NTW11_02510 [Candidatus Staskawiczbacteria bacterium]|nr:hypothetical protein [Candidatus Staskawiczbacteria bacterium]